MTERRDPTMTKDRHEADPGDATRDQTTPPAKEQAAGAVSTAEMAAAMEHRGAGNGTATTAAAPARAGEASAPQAPPRAAAAEPLFPGSEAESVRARWTSIQTGFVDEPRRAVEQADALVAEVIQRLAQVFAEERTTLEGQWGEGKDGDTEGLRVALRRYRSFFERLLST